MKIRKQQSRSSLPLKKSTLLLSALMAFLVFCMLWQMYIIFHHETKIKLKQSRKSIIGRYDHHHLHGGTIPAPRTKARPARPIIPKEDEEEEKPIPMTTNDDTTKKEETKKEEEIYEVLDEDELKELELSQQEEKNKEAEEEETKEAAEQQNNPNDDNNKKDEEGMDEDELKELELAHQEETNEEEEEEEEEEASLIVDAEKYPHTAKLPSWIQRYMKWHAEMRQQFPGTELFTNPNAPKLLIRTCLGLCGGLHDRLGQLPWDLYLANQTQRVFLLKWERPQPLEEFLVPSELLDWRVPAGVYAPSVKNKVSAAVRAIPQLFHTNCTTEIMETNPEPEFWNDHLPKCLAEAQLPESPRVLRHRLLGHLDEAILEQKLKALGETDTIHWKASFGHLFWSLFQPSPHVQDEVTQVQNSLNISENSYSAVHCRVRHPKATPPKVYVKGKDQNYPADKTGLPWEGVTRDFAIATASKALQCAKLQLQSEQEPIYFFADSNDLVRFVAHELTSPTFLRHNSSLLQQHSYDPDALRVVQSLLHNRVVSRDAGLENAHIDRQKGRPPEAYYATFVDLMIAVQARCVTYGIGYFALFATKLNVGNKAKCETPYVYQEETWGGRAGTKKGSATCPIHDSTYDAMWKK